ncbi:MAG: hypothetical protein CFH01_01424, partial [Alphaproteobacteria bacterium MarineAlpha2_Bin1]
MNKVKKYLILGVSLTLTSKVFFISGLLAQSYTTVIGGKGLPSVEVNLDSIHNTSQLSNKLKYPGQNISNK